MKGCLVTFICISLAIIAWIVSVPTEDNQYIPRKPSDIQIGSDKAYDSYRKRVNSPKYKKRLSDIRKNYVSPPDNSPIKVRKSVQDRADIQQSSNVLPKDVVKLFTEIRLADMEWRLAVERGVSITKLSGTVDAHLKGVPSNTRKTMKIALQEYLKMYPDSVMAKTFIRKL